MLAYLVNMAQAFVPAAAVAGLALAPVVRGGKWAAGLIALGLAAGGLAQQLAAAHGLTTATRVALNGAALAGAVIALHALALWRPGREHLMIPAALFVVPAAGAQGAHTFLAAVAGRSLTTASVINTELILNLAALGIGTGVLVAVVVLGLHSGRQAAQARGAALAAVLIVQGIFWGTEALLGLLQLQALEVTPWRVSLVARVTQARPLGTYLPLVLLALVALAASLGGRTAASAPGPAARRKVAARALAERRWLRGALATTCFVAAMLLYHDLYASLPPSLSPAQEVKADAEGLVRIRVDDVKDGRLHRFAYVTSDGHRVRFFLINRYDAQHVSIGVVFDACTICGDEGYIQRGDEIICIACNVRLFTPSIGKPGGCNPIPLDHAVVAGTIAIAAAELEQGARLFSEVVEIEVTDPVTGVRLVNLKAPFHYEHGGRTFYFEGRASYDAFRADPGRFVRGKPERT